MAYRFLADAVLVLHLAFILFVAFGALLAARRPRLLTWHLAAAAWGFTVEATGAGCPLTGLEIRLRLLAGEGGYAGGFIEHYLLPVVYPPGLDRHIQYLLAGAVLLLNVALYARYWHRAHGRERHCRRGKHDAILYIDTASVNAAMPNFFPIDLGPSTPDHIVGGESRRMHVKMYRSADDPITEATTDIELAREFIAHGELSAKSIQNTQKELYRFLTWCREEAGKTLVQLNVADLNAYKEFLKDPPPAWVSKTKWPRSDARYRPFTGPLSDPSRRQAMIAVKALLGFAEQTGYLRRNPAALVRNVRAPTASRITRYLTQGAIALALDTVSTRTAETPAELRRRARDRFLLVAFAHTGARLNEIVGASMGSIYTEGNGRWWLDVVGKGSKPRRLPVPPDMLEAFQSYRVAFDLPPQASRSDRMPLVLSSRSRTLSCITDEAASEAIKAIFADAAGVAAARGDADTAATLRQASAHWLRHSMLTNHANNGVQLKTLQDTAGHANIATTAAYLHKTDNERYDEIIASVNGRGIL